MTTENMMRHNLIASGRELKNQVKPSQKPKTVDVADFYQGNGFGSFICCFHYNA